MCKSFWHIFRPFAWKTVWRSKNHQWKYQENTMTKKRRTIRGNSTGGFMPYDQSWAGIPWSEYNYVKPPLDV